MDSRRKIQMKSKIAVSAICLLSVLSACSGKSTPSLSSILASGTLNVSTNAEFAPFEYYDGSTIVGVDADLISAYAKSINVTANIQDMEFDAALTAVSALKVDCAIAGITKNAEREKTMAFSDTYFKANQVAIVKNDSSYVGLAKAEDIVSAFKKDGIRIGVQRGTTGESYVTDSLSGDTVVSFDNGAMACQSLSQGQVQAVIIDLEPAKLYCKKISGITYLAPVLTEEEYAIALALSNTTLLASINAFIKTISTDGTLDSILGKYFGSEA
jgi:arginine/lysine/histidine transporter system substrate-binding protein